jgi:plasmid stabilization system protein ParE
MKCHLRPEARAELNDAALYYEDLREDLGDQFIEDFLLAVTEIEEAPQRWAEIHPGVRRFLLSRFPYKLIYRIGREFIDILAVAHLSRDEGYWHDRLR